jgi:hypothetical protein
MLQLRLKLLSFIVPVKYTVKSSTNQKIQATHISPNPVVFGLVMNLKNAS